MPRGHEHVHAHVSFIPRSHVLHSYKAYRNSMPGGVTVVRVDRVGPGFCGFLGVGDRVVESARGVMVVCPVGRREGCVFYSGVMSGSPLTCAALKLWEGIFAITPPRTHDGWARRRYTWGSVRL